MNEHPDRFNPDASGEARFVQRIKSELDRSCATLDGATQSRLNALRHAALAHGQRPQSWWSRILPAGSLATACALVLALVLQPVLQSGIGSADSAAPLEDIDLLVASEELDLYEEYEFYQWLATSDAAYGGGF